MKIECLREKLNSAVSKSEKAISKNINMPVLSCLLLEAKGNNLTIKSTNLDLGIEINIPAKVIEEGKTAVPAGIIGSFLNNISDDKNIILEISENILKITTSNSVADIKTQNSDDFPIIPKIENGKIVRVTAKELSFGIKSVIYSASNSTVKPELTSVYVYSNDDGLVFVATDSFRLAEKVIKLKKKVDLPGILIPAKNAGDILKIFDGIDEEIEINATKNQISFTVPGLYVVSRVIDGNFPDYKQILPKEEKTKVSVLKQDLLNTLKISNIFSDNFNQINISVKSGEKEIQLKTKNSNVGENTNKVDAKIEGEGIEVNFNYRYIAESLPSILSDSISLIFNGINRPLIIKGTSDGSFTYLVMPMNR